MSKQWSLTLAVCLAICLIMPAIAQDERQLSTANDGRTATIEEVLVTAERRERDIQSTPVAVTAFNAGALDQQQVVTFKDLHVSVPNLTVVNNVSTANAIQAYIRGVGQDDATFNFEPAVGLYVDGVYLARQFGGLASLWDIQSAEILRGPQGTLYGRNSSAGAIRYWTRKPEYDEFNGRFRLTAGSRSRLDVAGAVNVPVSDTLAFRVSGQQLKQEGYVDFVDENGVDTGDQGQNVDLTAGRASMLWQATGDLEMSVTLDFTSDDSGVVGLTPSDCSGFDAQTQVCPDLFGDPRKSFNNVPNRNRYRGYGGNVTLNYEGLPGVSIQSISSYREFDYTQNGDLTGRPSFALNIFSDLEQSQFFQELTLSSDGDSRLSWLLGGLYFLEDIDQSSTFLGTRNVDVQDSESYGVFAEVRYDLLENVTVFGGVRYSNDKKDIVRRQSTPVDAQLGTPLFGDFSDDEVAPRIGIEWQLSDTVFLYSTYSKGYKPGGFAAARPTSAVGATDTFGSETVDSIEVGARTSWFGGSLVANLTYFDSANDNLSQGILSANNTVFSVISGDARFKGIEFEGVARPAEWLELSAVVGYLDDEWERAPGGAGERLKHVPEFHAKIGAFYTMPIGVNNLSLFAGGFATHSGSMVRNFVNTRNVFTEEFTVVDLQVGIENDKYRLVLEVENVGDELYVEQGISSLGRYYSEPRNWLLQLDVNF